MDETQSAIAALYRAPFEAGGWTCALEQVASSAGAGIGNLIMFGGPCGISLNLVTGIDPSKLVGYERIPGIAGPSNYRIGLAAAPMHVIHEAHYHDYIAQHGHGIYSDVMDDWDAMAGCQAVLATRGPVHVGLATLRHRRDGVSDDGARERFAAMLRPALDAVRAEIALAGHGAQLIAQGPEHHDQALWLVDRHGRLAGLSRVADRLMASHDCPLDCYEGLLVATSIAEARPLACALDRMARNEGPSLVRLMLRGGPGAAPWLATLTRLPGAAGEQLGFAAAVALVLHPIPASPMH